MDILEEMLEEVEDFDLEENEKEDPQTSIVQPTDEEVARYSDTKDPRNQVVDFESDEFLDYISTLVGYVTTFLIPSVHEDEKDSFEWYDAQLAYFSIDSDCAINKCRQAGKSTAAAAKKYAKANLINTDYAIIFFSIKKEEAQNKINYIRNFIENSPKRFRRRIVYETKQSIEFENSDKSTTKVISHAQRISRGFHGDNVFDEADHYQDGRLQEIIDATLPGTRKVGGTMEYITTPFDPIGIFKDIMEGGNKYNAAGEKIDEWSHVTKLYLKWWNVPFYVNENFRDSMEELDRVILNYPLRDRVYKFGSKILIYAYDSSSSEEIFLQEYEGVFPSFESRFFPPHQVKGLVLREYEEIFHQDESLHWNDEVDPELVELDDQRHLFPMERLLKENKKSLMTYGNPEDPDSISELIDAYRRGELSSNLFIGIDIGTSGHSTDIKVCEEVDINGTSYMVERFWAFKHEWPLPEQQKYFKYVFENLPHVAAGMDTNGLGTQMGQYFENQFPHTFNCMPMYGNNLTKIFTSLKTRFSAGSYAILGYQENIKGFTEVRKSNKGTTIRWVLKKTKTNHCDSAISSGICSALGDEYSRLKIPSSNIIKEQISRDKLLSGEIKSHEMRKRNIITTTRSGINHSYSPLLSAIMNKRGRKWR